MSTMPSLASSVIYRFDRFELLPEVEELRKQGMLIRLDRGAVVRAALRRTLPRLLAKARNHQLDRYTLTCHYAQMGEIDEAFKALDRAISEQSASAMFAFVDPRLDRMRSDPRFIDFLDRLGLMR